jgi:hypothetical protein
MCLSYAPAILVLFILMLGYRIEAVVTSAKTIVMIS